MTDLRIELRGSGAAIVEQISFALRAGEVLGLVGESGSGKTTVGMALLGHVRRGGRIGGGSVLVDGADVAGASDAQLERLRGRVVAYVPQDPGSGLNPALRVGSQLTEVLDAHLPQLSAAERAARLAELLEEVGLPGEERFLRSYPHQLSGGQQQRVLIAMAFAPRPSVVVCDEPTTGLDVTTQARVLQTLRELCRAHGVAALYVSHDLAVVGEIADRIAVMYAGRIVEQGPAAALLSDPRHPYTRLLLRAVPDAAGDRTPLGIAGHAPPPGARPSGCAFHPRCPLASEVCARQDPPAVDLDARFALCHHVALAPGISLAGALPAASELAVVAPEAPVLELRGLSAAHAERTTLHDVELAVGRDECVALVGESGSGKTTLARCVAGLHGRYDGEVRFEGELLPGSARGRSRDARRGIQYVFQNPYASLNPRRTVGATIARQLQLFGDVSRRDARRAAVETLARVALAPGIAEQRPDELSGGERQRVAIARALAAQPRLLVCDEVTSALDVSVQATIVALLRELRDESGLSLLFITHDLALVRTVADRVAVLSDGRIVEQGAVADVFRAPAAGYTRELLANTPRLEDAARLREPA
ncbi:ABC transporter ATP-binding protein [Conexibacter sp. CPCC 206217]|uniref:ABC transporter ATP-binding protein n=1 Tax=Conexibacter sp. CPCC 206217 TaxID=3064574 RepID=UPI00271FC015|nr:ABC transporter ATP-binding protein [Conexibacter sp. CPCC 206217]MDO8212622.1 ABC transporter ATP-binding protein [Conexibacter sp. CPCC 206217]